MFRDAAARLAGLAGAVLEADEAKAIAEYRLACLWAARASAKLCLGWRRAAVRPGMLVRIGGQAGLWKVERWTLQRMVAKLELIGVPAGLMPAAGASPGRAVGNFDEPVGPTVLRVFDLPSLTDEASDRPRLLAVAAGAGEGWRRAELETSYDGGMNWTPAGSTAGPAILGHAMSALPAGGSTLLDERSSIEVELVNDAMWLEARSDAALASGANLAVLGDELIQFGGVDPLGGRRFRLSRLLRGRRGTEWAAATHAAGEPFALIQEENVLVLEPPAAMLGGEAKLLATGVGDGAGGVAAARRIGGGGLAAPIAGASQGGKAWERRRPYQLGAAEPKWLGLAERQRHSTWGGKGGVPRCRVERGSPAHLHLRPVELHLHRDAAGGRRPGRTADDHRRAAGNGGCLASRANHHLVEENMR